VSSNREFDEDEMKRKVARIYEANGGVTHLLPGKSTSPALQFNFKTLRKVFAGRPLFQPGCVIPNRLAAWNASGPLKEFLNFSAVDKEEGQSSMRCAYREVLRNVGMSHGQCFHADSLRKVRRGPLDFCIFAATARTRFS
jgi:hypothetical protein